MVHTEGCLCRCGRHYLLVGSKKLRSGKEQPKLVHHSGLYHVGNTDRKPIGIFLQSVRAEQRVRLTISF